MTFIKRTFSFTLIIAAFIIPNCLSSVPAFFFSIALLSLFYQTIHFGILKSFTRIICLSSVFNFVSESYLALAFFSYNHPHPEILILEWMLVLVLLVHILVEEGRY